MQKPVQVESSHIEPGSLEKRSVITIAALGDSITAALTGDFPMELRWLPQVEAGLRAIFLDKNIRAVNAATGGHTSREGLARFEEAVTAHAPDIVLIEFGGNDITPDPGRHVSREEFESNILAMIRSARELAAEPVLLTFPPILDAWHAFWPDEPFRSGGGKDWCVEVHREITRRLAREHSVPLADIDHALRAAMRRDGVGSQILPDGVHLTVAGNRTAAECVLTAILPLLQG